MTDQRLALIQASTDLESPELRKDKNIDDIVLMKQMILKDLFSDPDIIETLHNTELEAREAPPEDYYNVNIFSFLKIPDTQSVVKNFICFEVNDLNETFYSTTFLEKGVMFRTVSHEDDYKTEYGIDRQDLLGMLIKDRYNWSNFMGMRLQKEYDSGKIAQNGYYYREIRFRVTSPNAMVQKNRYIQNLDRSRGVYDSQRRN